jgi:hypothetical protein
MRPLAVATLSALALPCTLANPMAGQTRQSFPRLQVVLPKAPPVGLPPTNLRIFTSGPGQQNIQWDVNQPFYNFTLQRQDPGSASWQLITPQPINLKGAADVAFVPPGAIYRVTANYADGTVGTADITHLNPVPPTHPANFKAKQSAEVTVDLSWGPVQSATGYQLFGPGQPASGTLVKGQSFQVTGLQPGTYQFNVASVFPPGMWTGPAPSTTVNVIRLTATYRVWINGYTAVRTTNDFSPLRNDGAGDEIYAAANAYLYNSLGDQRPSSLTEVKSMLLGDGSGGGAPRIPMGTASRSGGIRSGDVLPTGVNPALPNNGLPTPHQLPLLVWEGSLTNNQQFLVVTPALWESDGDMTGYNFWKSSWRSMLFNGVGLSSEALGGLKAPTIAPIVPIARFTNGAWASVPADEGQDRPIGARSSSTGPRFTDSGLVLTQDLIERTLTAAGSSKFVFSIDYQDAQGLGNGFYTLYIEIDRMP